MMRREMEKGWWFEIEIEKEKVIQRASSGCLIGRRKGG